MARSGNKSNPSPHTSHLTAHTALIIFAKSPIPGSVKTRLCPPLTSDEAATLHGSLVLDTLEQTKQLKGIDRILACSPSQQHPFFQAIAARHRVQLWEQIPVKDLGERMDQAVQTAFERQYSMVVIIGSDLPTIATDIIQQAVQALSEHDIVIGPSQDGGYYLIGLKQPNADVFSDIPWSTDQVTRITEQKITALGFTLTLLPQQRDVDTIEDLQYYMKESECSLKTRVSSRTGQVLKTLSTRLMNRE